MENLKKISLLKQVENGFSTIKECSAILRIETENGFSRLFLSAVNFKFMERGEYQLFLLDQNQKLFAFNLGSLPSSFSSAIYQCPSVSKFYSAGIVYVSDFLPTLVCFYTENPQKQDVSAFKKVILEKCLSDKKNDEKPICNEPKLTYPEELKQNQKYDDEAVATENYYLLDQQINKKISEIGQLDNELLRNENGNADNFFQEKKEEKPERFNGFSNETDQDFSQQFDQNNPYYESAKQELDELFSTFSLDTQLNEIFHDSRWVKIFYDEEKFYVVGQINQNGIPKYICYGVPGEYNDGEPEELKGYCSFVPASLFDLTGNGYYMMFQDAVTGKCVKKD